jgi:ATP-binding cassette subfamily F protein uup
LGKGERLGIIGPNGAGKSTLLRLCEGALTPDAGTVTTGETVRFASIDQKRTQLDPTKTVVQEVAGKGSHVRMGEEVRRIEGFLDQFLFAGDHKHALVETLSGGERNRVLLAKLLCAGGNVLLLDEPTNDLDLMTLRALEEALVAFPGTVLVVSHDRYFLDRVATRVLHLDGDGHARQDVCAVSRLLERLAEERKTRATQANRANKAATRAAASAASEQRRGDTAGAPSAAASEAATTARNRLSNWEQSEYDALPERIATAEERVAELDARLAQPDLYAGPIAERRKVEAERAEAGAEVSALYERWEALEERAG